MKTHQAQPMTSGGADDGDDLARLFAENSRRWLPYWSWRDKPVAEREATDTVLSGAGLEVRDIRSRKDGEDPPDCEAIVNGVRCGIEVTELVHEPTLRQSIQAIRAREKGRKVEAPEAYFAWERDDLLAALQALIDRKDDGKPKGGPYDRYFLVIVTDEWVLDRDTVGRFLEGAKFRAEHITDVLLGLSYHPSPEPGGGSCPVFTLACLPHSTPHQCGDAPRTILPPP